MIYNFILLLLLIVTLLITLVIFFNFIFPILWGAPYAPSNMGDLIAALEYAKIQPGEQAADLGSGDGRAVIMMAEKGANAVGYEISPFLVWWSRLRANKTPADIHSRIKFYRQSFWNINLSKFDVIFLYQLPHVMKRMRAKLTQELKPTARVVCIGFKMESWIPAETNGRVFVYNAPQK